MAACIIILVSALVARFVAVNAAHEILAGAVPTESPSPKPETLADLSAFENHPDAATWTKVHDDIMLSRFDTIVESRIIGVVVRSELPRRVLNAILVDLSDKDSRGTFAWLHAANVVAQSDPSPESAATIARTAEIIWLMLELRVPYDQAAVDLTHTDLRSTARFVGQAMNLQNINFTGSLLPGGTWRKSNLGQSLFTDVSTAGRLTCESCSWGSLTFKGTAVFADGAWITKTSQ
jgi:hypothetical protein